MREFEFCPGTPTVLLRAARWLCTIVLVVLVSSLHVASSAGGFDQDLGPVAICIGDICCIDDVCAANGSYTLGCEFVRAHPNDADEQAAKYIFTIQNRYSSYSYVRRSFSSGGACGKTILVARCR
jgi:hypothetical protein